MRQGDILEISVQGLTYKTPPLPKLATIRRTSNKPAEQVWARDLSYENWAWTETITEKGVDREELIPQERWLPEQIEWYEAEIERLHFGTWHMMNGLPVYLNKYCYFFLQWFCLLGTPPPGQRVSRPTFKDVSLEYFYFFQLCEEDRFCFGDIGIKGRRVGLSSMSASIKVLIGILESNTLSGIVSKTGTDAQEMYFMVKNGIENLPMFLTPEIAAVNDGEIHIAKQVPRISRNNKYLTGDKGKNNRINWLDTSETAYDGREMRHITCDEAGKWIKNVKTWFTKASDTLIAGTTMRGKVSVFTTVDKGDKGGDNFRELWDGSDHINGKRDVYGRTKTKLRRFFIPAYRGYLGYIGKYGESIIENPTPEQIEWLKTYEYYDPVSKKWEKCPDPYIGAKQWLQVTRDMKAGDLEDLAEEMRKNPFDWKEVFKGANNLCHFNLEDINDQIERLETLLEGTNKKENGRRMTFKPQPDGTKLPVDDPAGMWYVIELIENNNRHVKQNGIQCPDNVAYGAAGLDTYHNARATVDKGSDACMLIFSRYNPLNPQNSYRAVAMFLGRPSRKLEFFMQLHYGLEYYGVKMLGERSPTDWIDYFTENDLASPEEEKKVYGYLTGTKRADDSFVYGIPNQQSKNTMEAHLTLMIEYALNNMHKIPFIRLLKEMIKFNIADRTDYDCCMAFGYALMALGESVKQATPPRKNTMSILPVNRAA